VSAAANPVLPEVSTPYKGPLAKVGSSYFKVFLKDTSSHAARACYGLILNETSKKGSSAWARIKREQFADNANVDKNYVGDQLEFLETCGWIRHRDPDGRPSKREYSIAPQLQTEARADKITGRCSLCKVIGQFTTSFIVMPRTFFTHLPKALKPATYLVVALVSQYSHDHAWTGPGGLIPRWKEINFNDLERDSDLSASSISEAIAEAVAYRLIERNPRPGKASEYRTLPHNWDKVPVRTLRLVNQPIKPKSPKSPKPKPVSENPANPPKQPQPSPTFKPQGLCAACLHIVDVLPVSAEEEAQEREKQQETAVETINRPPRAGPTRAQSLIVNEPFSRVPKWKGLS